VSRYATQQGLIRNPRFTYPANAGVSREKMMKNQVLMATILAMACGGANASYISATSMASSIDVLAVNAKFDGGNVSKTGTGVAVQASTYGTVLETFNMYLNGCANTFSKDGYKFTDVRGAIGPWFDLGPSSALAVYATANYTVADVPLVKYNNAGAGIGARMIFSPAKRMLMSIDVSGSKMLRTHGEIDTPSGSLTTDMGHKYQVFSDLRFSWKPIAKSNAEFHVGYRINSFNYRKRTPANVDSVPTIDGQFNGAYVGVGYMF
jgi:hypothetical protein